ncbi:MAG: DUF1559 domain-containing protein [Planctomycetes bacterium]|nr:DUF1559 domain-containing protein [Planctomycetota bacterium]
MYDQQARGASRPQLPGLSRVRAGPAATPANGPFWGKGVPLTFNNVTDGLSTTIFIGERHVPKGKFGMAPWDNSIYNGDHGCGESQGGTKHPIISSASSTSSGFGSYHPGVCQFVFGDGGVRPIQSSIDPTKLGYLCNRQDGQVATFD